MSDPVNKTPCAYSNVDDWLFEDPYGRCVDDGNNVALAQTGKVGDEGDSQAQGTSYKTGTDGAGKTEIIYHPRIQDALFREQGNRVIHEISLPRSVGERLITIDDNEMRARIQKILADPKVRELIEESFIENRVNMTEEIQERIDLFERKPQP